MSFKIHYALMTQNELSDIIPNVEKALPYVDSVTIVDGGSIDGTIMYFRNWAKAESKIRFFIHPWEDDFPGQRNKCLKHIADIASPGDWLVFLDPDEYFEERTFQKLRQAAEYAEKNGANMVGFQCRSVSTQGPERVWENLDEYWKQLFIKWDPRFHYTGHKCHEGKGGIPHNILNTDLVYEHVKQENVIWLRGMRNSLVGGSGDNLGTSCPNFVRAKEILTALGINTWHEMYNYMLKGNIDKSVKDFMVDMVFEGTPNAGPNCWRNYDWPGSSEWREWYKAYFRILHPEEEEAFVGQELDDRKFLGWE